MRKHMKRTCPKCHKWKPRNLYAKHKHVCMGGKPVNDGQSIGGTGKGTDYKVKQKKGEKK